MSGRLFLLNESVPRRLLKAGLVEVDQCCKRRLSEFLFPFRLEVMDVDDTAGRRLARVDHLPSVEALMIYFSLMCCCDLLDHAVLRMRSCSD